MNPTPSGHWQYLAPNPKSAYKQLFIKGTRIRAEIPYGMTVDGEPPHMTPEEVAADMDLPLEAVREAILYCETCPEDIFRDHAMEEASMIARGMKDPNYNGQPRVVSPEEKARIRRAGR